MSPRWLHKQHSKRNVQALPFKKGLSSGCSCFQVCTMWQCWHTKSWKTKTKQKNLRKAEEKGGGPNQEGGGCRHRNISAGSKWTGRGRNGATYSSPNHGTTESRHRRDKQTEKKGRKTERRSMPTDYKWFFSGQNWIYNIRLRGHDFRLEKKNFSKQQLKGNIINSLYLESHQHLLQYTAWKVCQHDIWNILCIIVIEI